MAEDIAFGGGSHQKASVKTSGGKKHEVPQFHNRPAFDDGGEVTINSSETLREKAIVADLADRGTMSGAPKL